MRIVCPVNSDVIYTLKDEFFTKYPGWENPEHGIWGMGWVDDNNYLHCETGPAVEHLNFASGSYWLNGKHMFKEQWEVEVANLKFNRKLDELLT